MLMIRQLILVLFTFFVLPSTLLADGWSRPPKVVYPETPPNNTAFPFISTDNSNGSCVAVWYDVLDPILGTINFRGATLAPGAVNAQGQPAWQLTSLIAPDLEGLQGFSTQPVGMDGNGNALAAWSDDNNHIFGSILTSGSSTWSLPFLINNPPLTGETVYAPYVSVAPNGNAAVIWSSSLTPYNDHIVVNIFNGQTQAWKGPQELFGGATQNLADTNQVLINDQGTAVAVLSSFPFIQAASYNFLTNTWKTITPLTTSSLVQSVIALDPAGNALVAAVGEDLTLTVAALPFQADAFINPQTLSTTVLFEPPSIQSDAAGNAVVIWGETSGGLASARYSVDTGTWTLLPLLDLRGNVVALPNLSVDARGNAVAVWFTTDDSQIYYIESAALGVNDTFWTLLTRLSSSLSLSAFPRVALTSQGTAVAVWEEVDDSESIIGTIFSSNYLSMFPSAPLPPTNFKGKVVQDRFLSQTDIIHKLTWNASPTPGVKNYTLYRNGVLIAIIPAVGNSFVYTDHNRHKKALDVYTLNAVISMEAYSTPVFVTLP